MSYKTLKEALQIYLNEKFIEEVMSWPISYFISQIQTPMKGASEERKKILRELCLSYGFELPPWLWSKSYYKRRSPNVGLGGTGDGTQLGG